MAHRSEAFAAYMKDIYAQYDALADAAASSSALTLSASEYDNLTLVNMPEGDIEALAFLVLMEAARSAQEDLKAVMNEVKAINQVKQRLRDALDKLNERAHSVTEPGDDDDHERRQPLDPCAQLDIDLFVQTLLMVAARQSDDLLRTLADEVVLTRERRRRAEATGAPHDVLNALSEMTELQQLRLQMMMDRRSKFLETLSNIMKKMAETQKSIVDNLK